MIHPWPHIFPWFTDALPVLNRQIVMRALQDLGTCEEPAGSNRGERIDEWNKRAGSPLGSFWCASWATSVWEDAGAEVPFSERASCDRIVSWALHESLWIPNNSVSRDPRVYEGHFVVYTNREKLASGNLDAVHIGVVIRCAPYLLSLEGNSSLGGAFSANGEAVVLRRVDVRRVYGFVRPRLALR